MCCLFWYFVFLVWQCSFQCVRPLDIYIYFSLTKDFTGNVNKRGTAKTVLRETKAAHFMRLKPLEWHDAIAVRMEVYGCMKSAFTKCVV